MKIQRFPNKMSMGLFSQTSDDQVTAEQTLFIGTAEEFAVWEFKPERELNIVLRLRLPSTIPVEFRGILLEDGTLLLKQVRANDGLYAGTATVRTGGD